MEVKEAANRVFVIETTGISFLAEHSKDIISFNLFATIFWGKYFYYTHFRDGEIEAWGLSWLHLENGRAGRENQVSLTPKPTVLIIPLYNITQQQPDIKLAVGLQ